MMASSVYSWDQYLNNTQSPITLWSLGFWCMLALCSVNACAEANAVNNSGDQIEEPMPVSKPVKKADAEEVDTLPEVTVTDTRTKAPETGINRTLPITTITSEQLQRAQPSNIFDALRSVPGVSITGGPRPSGMTFNIRGYGDNEDVMVKVDGVPKGFEKYRMGGTFIEPELLKSVEVQRGPQITSGSGSLGGTVRTS